MLAAALVSGIAAGATDAQKCRAALELGSGNYAACVLKAESQFTKTGDGAALGTALTRCSDRFGKAYGHATARWSGSCPVVEPASSLEAHLLQCTTATASAAAGGTLMDFCGDGVIDVGEQCDGGDLGGASCPSLGYEGGTLACAGLCTYDTTGCHPTPAFPATGQTTCWDAGGAAIPCAGTGHDGEVQAGATLSYVDNADGTITDVNTGLVWEKLSDDGSVHDKDDAYDWTAALSVKVAALNAGSGFAGHTDWRLPNVKELGSIVDYQFVVPPPPFNDACVPGCTVSTCSCANTTYHWSATSDPSLPSTAWLVRSSGESTTGLKSSTGSVRAVRGGL